MLLLDGNRAFARNLLEYLTRGDRLLLAGPNTTILGQVAPPRDTRRPLERLSWSLERLANLNLPPRALLIMSMIIALGMLWLAWTALPRRAAYAAAGRMVTPVPAAGIVGRAAHLVGEDPDRTRAIIEAARRQT
jgi:hypothetical protein